MDNNNNNNNNNNKNVTIHIELYETVSYEINKLKENISNINIFLHDISNNDIKNNDIIDNYCSQKQDIEKLIERKIKTAINIEKYLFDNCKHNWVKDFSESAIYGNVKINPFHVCKKCSIIKPI